jgi:hypothetical protein
MSASPRLYPVPPFHHELTIKATHNGIILLKDGRYKKRYTGSRYSTVDINGNLYEKAADLKKIQAAELEGTVKTKKRVNKSHLVNPGPSLRENEDSTNVSLYTKEKKICEYRVNKMEVRQRILSMINTMKGGKELYFWTVTFPLGMPDDLCYQCFNTWLTALRQKKMLKDYIWIAERQQNNTIHFHIAIPHKMHVVTANRMMRVTLATFAKKKLINYSVFQCKRYNGVDISKNRKTGRVTNFAIKKGARALANYLTKYVTKNDAGFPHLAWHNSRGYSSLFTGITFTIAEFVAAGYKELIYPRSIHNNEFFSFYRWLEDPPEPIVKHLYDVNSHLQKIVDKVA